MVLNTTYLTTSCSFLRCSCMSTTLPSLHASGSLHSKHCSSKANIVWPKLWKEGFYARITLEHKCMRSVFNLLTMLRKSLYNRREWISPRYQFNLRGDLGKLISIYCKYLLLMGRVVDGWNGICCGWFNVFQWTYKYGYRYFSSNYNNFLSWLLPTHGMGLGLLSLKV